MTIQPGAGGGWMDETAWHWKSIVFRDAGAFSVGPGALDRTGIPVRGQDEGRRRRGGSRLDEDGLPKGLVEIGPVHEGKAAVKPRRNAKCQEGGFDGDGAGAAEGIEQRRGLVPAGGKEQPGGEGLAQRRLGDRLAVAALVQKCPGGIHADGAFIVGEADHHQLGRHVIFIVHFE